MIRNGALITMMKMEEINFNAIRRLTVLIKATNKTAVSVF